MAALAEGFLQVLDLFKLSYFNDENTTETGQPFYMNGPFKGTVKIQLKAGLKRPLDRFFVGIEKRRTSNIEGRILKRLTLVMNAGPSKGTVKVTVWTYYLLIEEGKKANFRVLFSRA